MDAESPLKPTRPYGDVFEYDNTPLKPGETVAIMCSGKPSTWTASQILQAGK
jgi:hypothetical protein